jgi:hypothetical protein
VLRRCFSAQRWQCRRIVLETWPDRIDIWLRWHRPCGDVACNQWDERRTTINMDHLADKRPSVTGSVDPTNGLTKLYLVGSWSSVRVASIVPNSGLCEFDVHNERSTR